MSWLSALSSSSAAGSTGSAASTAAPAAGAATSAAPAIGATASTAPSIGMGAAGGSGWGGIMQKIMSMGKPAQLIPAPQMGDMPGTGNNPNNALQEYFRRYGGK